MLGFRPLLYLRLTHLPLVPYMHQWIGSALAQIMACRLFGAKPLSKPMLGYCQLDCQEQTSVKMESEFYHFHSRKCIWKCHLPEWRPFCPGGDELSQAMHSLRQLTHWGWDKMTKCHFAAIFPLILLYEICCILHFDLNFTEICSQVANKQKSCIDPDNGFALNRFQAIT